MERLVGFVFGARNGSQNLLEKRSQISTFALGLGACDTGFGVAVENWEVELFLGGVEIDKEIVGLVQDLLGTGVRVAAVSPGLVETEFSQVRFHGDTARAAQTYRGLRPLTADDIAEAVLFVATRPAHVDVSEVLIMPTDQASVYHAHRSGG